MAATSIAFLIVIIVIGVAALLAVIFGTVRWLVRRAASELLAHVEATGQGLVRGPEYGSFRGAERIHGRVKCDGAIAATAEKLMLQRAIGGRLDVDFADVVDVTTEKAFMGSWRAGQPVLVLKTRMDNRIGFFVQDTEAWETLIREHMNNRE